MRGVTFERVKEIVETNNKQRFTLLLEQPNASSASADTMLAAVPVEIPHSTQVTIPALPGSEMPTDLEERMKAGGTWYIRANQGHTLKVRWLTILPLGYNLTYNR
jgi:RNA:NAD 2'-phosphotransferase (TPT1/KptA family)